MTVQRMSIPPYYRPDMEFDAVLVTLDEREYLGRFEYNYYPGKRSDANGPRELPGLDFVRAYVQFAEGGPWVEFDLDFICRLIGAEDMRMIENDAFGLFIDRTRPWLHKAFCGPAAIGQDDPETEERRDPNLQYLDSWG